jgi:hypothetical protein
LKPTGFLRFFFGRTQARAVDGDEHVRPSRHVAPSRAPRMRGQDGRQSARIGGRSSDRCR